MQKLKALLVGQSADLMRAVPFLLSRAGFEVDVFATDWIYQSKFILNYEIFPNKSEFLQKLSEKNLKIYELVVICDDTTLSDVVKLDIDLEKKLKLLPVTQEKDFKHLYSKIGLSQVLSEAQILIPDFVVAKNFNEMFEAAHRLGYPLMVKVDSSSGGGGVFECKSFADLELIDPELLKSPLLIQKKIEGEELDLSSFYREGKLISFDYSKIVKAVKKFGPSSIRLYEQLSNLDESVFLQMQKLGEVLGADGFANVVAIKSAQDGKIYFLEADMRPNVWVDSAKFVGEDWALRIANWFNEGLTLQYPQAIRENYSKELLIPFCFRIPILEVLCNRHNVWRFISRQEIAFFYQDFSRKIRFFLWRVNRIPTLTIRVFVPIKKDRARIRFYFEKLFKFLFNALPLDPVVLVRCNLDLMFCKKSAVRI